MKDRQHGAVAARIEELVDVPGSGERAGFGFAVANDGGYDEFGIVEGRAAGVREDVAEFTAFVDGAGGFRRAVAADASGEGELLEEFFQSFVVLALVGIDLGVGAFEIAGSENAGRAVSGAGHENHVEVVLLDEPIKVDICERQAGAGAPMTEQTVLDVLGAQGFMQQGIVEEVDYAEAEG